MTTVRVLTTTTTVRTRLHPVVKVSTSAFAPRAFDHRGRVTHGIGRTESELPDVYVTLFVLWTASSNDRYFAASTAGNRPRCLGSTMRMTIFPPRLTATSSHGTKRNVSVAAWWIAKMSTSACEYPRDLTTTIGSEPLLFTCTATYRPLTLTTKSVFDESVTSRKTSYPERDSLAARASSEAPPDLLVLGFVVIQAKNVFTPHARWARLSGP
jgi:hypothetical protein